MNELIICSRYVPLCVSEAAHVQAKQTQRMDTRVNDCTDALTHTVVHTHKCTGTHSPARARTHTHTHTHRNGPCQASAYAHARKKSAPKADVCHPELIKAG